MILVLALLASAVSGQIYAPALPESTYEAPLIPADVPEVIPPQELEQSYAPPPPPPPPLLPTGHYPAAIPPVEYAPPPQEQKGVEYPDSVVSPSEGDIVLAVGTRVDVRDDRGQFSAGFSSPEGTKVSEQGRLITTNGGWEYVIAKTGSYSYTSPEGVPVHVDWVADENGFRHV